MNGKDAELALENVEDGDILILVAIVNRAAEHPLKSYSEALNIAYRAELADREIDLNRDKTIYNWVYAVGNRCVDVHTEDEPANIQDELEYLLSTKNITLERNRPEDEDEDSQEWEDHSQHPKPKVQFDDEKYEIGWPNGHLQDVKEQTPGAKAPSKKRAPTPGRPYHGQRTRSLESEQMIRPALKPTHHSSPSSYYTSEPEGTAELSMHSQPELKEDERDAQLQDILDAFQAMSEVRMLRQHVHMWHDALMDLNSRNATASAIATAHDGRTLLRQALDLWNLAMQAKRDERRQEEEFERMERRAVWFRSLMLAQKGFEHWHASHLALKTKTLRAGQLLLALRYFRRWRSITVENNAKARQILTRKFLGRWRDRTARRELVYEQATAYYEESLERRVFAQWRWKFYSRNVEDQQEQRLARRVLRRWSEHSQRVQALDQQAEETNSRRLLRSTFRSLHSQLISIRQASASAQACYDRKASSRHMQTLRVQSRLKPLEKIMSLRVTLTLQRKAFSVWHLHLSLTRQAAEIDRKRVLHDAWTNWNDALRTRALSQRINERVLVESLYKWVLEGRLSLFRRAADARLARHALLLLHGAAGDYRSTLEDRAAIFAENQRRRRLTSSMVRLNIALRRHEDADRAAVEFANSRALPDVLSAWKEQTEHARFLAKQAASARWYCLCFPALKAWRLRTTEHQHQRRRDAYIHIRARVKQRMASKCFTAWRTQGMEIQSMKQEAERRAQARVFAIGTHAFDRLRESTEQQRSLETQAANVDHQRLLVSALSAMLARHSYAVALERSAASFLLSSDLALQASALKRLQWAAFTTSQQSKSADALLARNQEQHRRQILRYWFAQALATRKARTEAAETNFEPESPSIRPASRAAIRSASKDRFTNPQTASYTPQGTPRYMRTPSRGRAGRFRPIPTPAAVTPFAFDAGYLTTTPAPFTAAGTGSSPMPAAAGGLTPQVTPFVRKLRAGGFASMPPSALRNSVLGRSVAAPATGKSVRFARAGRFAQSTAGRIEDPQEEEERENDDGQEVHFKSS